MLLSVLGTGGSAAVWAIFGFAAAALTYAATIAALYAIVVRIVAAPRAQPEREPHRGAGEPSSLWPGDAAGPTLDP